MAHISPLFGVAGKLTVIVYPNESWDTDTHPSVGEIETEVSERIKQPVRVRFLEEGERTGSKVYAVDVLRQTAASPTADAAGRSG